MRVIRWLWRYWYIPVIALAGFAGWLLGGRRAPVDHVKDELDTIRRAEEARRVSIEKGAELANALADIDHRKTLEALDDKQRKKADDLRRDPGKRIRFLRRMAKQLGKR